LEITAIDNCVPDSATKPTTNQQLINTKVRVRSQASPCETYDEQSGTALGFSHSVSVFAYS
jgi:hypothetical protein